MTVQATSSNAPRTFADALQAAGITSPRQRAELALKVGVDAVTVWRWKNGKSKPASQATRDALARELHRTADEIDDLFAEPEDLVA